MSISLEAHVLTSSMRKMAHISWTSKHRLLTIVSSHLRGTCCEFMRAHNEHALQTLKISIYSAGIGWLSVSV